MTRSTQTKKGIAWVVLLMLLFVTSCQNLPSQTNIPAPLDEPSMAHYSTTSSMATPEPAPSDEERIETTAPNTPSPSPATTLADWRDAPIMPTALSSRVHEIYQSGQVQGRDPAAFSVIGDCQSIPFVFMGPFGRGDQTPDASESQLWKAIEYFYPSFQRWAVTARGGFTAASVINPLQADPTECKPGETPLTCEFRLNNPAFVLITLETWLDPESIDRYEVYLRKILDMAIAQGAVPILLTKADASELKGEKHVINPVIVNLAYEYQLPVINFWRAAQYLDNYGIDPEREGFHLSETGYRLKNTLALRALHQVWTAMEAPSNGAGQIATGSSSPTVTTTVGPVNHDPALPDCEDGCVFFGAAQSEDGSVTAQGVYAYNAKNQTLTQVLGSGFDLQDVSADGARLLVNQGSRLFVVDLTISEVSRISETYANSGKQGAFWDDRGEVHYLDSADPILTETGEAIQLLPNRASDDLYFESGICTPREGCTSEGVFVKTSDGAVSALTAYQQPVFSPDGSRMAFLNPDAATNENYFHISYLVAEETATGIASRRVLYLPDEAGFEVYPEVTEYAFSSDGSQLFLLYNVYSEYYEQSLRLQTYLWDLETGILYDMGKLDDVSGSLHPRFVWSPDGSRVLLFLTDRTESGVYTIQVYETDLTTGEKLKPVTEDLLTGTDYLYMTNVYWK